MDTLHLVDPEMRDIVAQFPPLAPTRESLPALRKAVVGLYPPADTPFEERHIPGPEGAPEVRVLVHRPPVDGHAPPAILYLHGGGFIAGTPDMMAADNAKLAREQGAVVVAVQYRLAPETVFPGPVEDCYAALRWMEAEADALGIDPTRIVIFGQSAGGGLAAATALLARDRGGPALKAQFLLYPMLDERTGTPEAPIDNPVTGAFGWTRESNRFGWSALRGEAVPSSESLPYFSPAEADDLSGLPPTFVAVGSLDLFLEESLAYAQRLSRVGVPIEAHVYPGAIHGFDMFAGANADSFRVAFGAALARALAC
ncbi:alpha/beta hydrolase [Aureimonas populi]|uniref:Alpha/beta hydrolase n=1 Tax=Aureimonas populi TaxID=1701758 RepID=A0ABW5CJ02_9HYPH|nr:alpha/beta hydrolase [Aureimonas populi]